MTDQATRERENLTDITSIRFPDALKAAGEHQASIEGMTFGAWVRSLVEAESQRRTVVAPNELLSPEEFEALECISKAAIALFKIVGRNDNDNADAREVADKIHQLQCMVMSQAACRAYPESFRLLGETKIK